MASVVVCPRLEPLALRCHSRVYSRLLMSKLEREAAVGVSVMVAGSQVVMHCHLTLSSLTATTTRIFRDVLPIRHATKLEDTGS